MLIAVLYSQSSDQLLYNTLHFIILHSDLVTHMQKHTVAIDDANADCFPPAVTSSSELARLMWHSAIGWETHCHSNSNRQGGTGRLLHHSYFQSVA